MSNKEATTSAEISRKEKEVENANQPGLVKFTFDPIERMTRGFKDFKISYIDAFKPIWRQQAERDPPLFLMFGCSDSRADPTNIITLGVGEAYVVRNIANLVPTFNKNRYSSIGAVIEYAVLSLKVEFIVVFGHSRCDGIKRLISLSDKNTSDDFIDDWVRIAQPAKDKVKKDHPHASGEQLATLVEKESVKNSLANLLSYPYVRSGVVDKKFIKLFGVYYDFVHEKFEIFVKPKDDI